MRFRRVRRDARRPKADRLLRRLSANSKGATGYLCEVNAQGALTRDHESGAAMSRRQLFFVSSLRWPVRIPARFCPIRKGSRLRPEQRRWTRRDGS